MYIYIYFSYVHNCGISYGTLWFYSHWVRPSQPRAIRNSGAISSHKLLGDVPLTVGDVVLPIELHSGSGWGRMLGEDSRGNPSKTMGRPWENRGNIAGKSRIKKSRFIAGKIVELNGRFYSFDYWKVDRGEALLAIGWNQTWTTGHGSQAKNQVNISRRCWLLTNGPCANSISSQTYSKQGAFSNSNPPFPWFSHVFPYFPMIYTGFPMVFPWFSHDFPMIFPLLENLPATETRETCQGLWLEMTTGATCPMILQDRDEAGLNSGQNPRKNVVLEGLWWKIMENQEWKYGG